MFDKILIANRGEIACRVMETAAKLGVKTVAVYSDADASAKHVRMADEAVHIGGSAPAESYLRGELIIAAALRVRAQAIHPGYGFLSENPEFVEAVEAAGLVFVGPSATAIRAMGLKDAAKVLMQKAGVPVVPGYHGANQDGVFLRQQATEVGYPVLIKAVAGGGGKGMRLVEADAEFDAALASAQGEAQTAFGNPDVLIEKFIQSPRHIEVQVFGDGQSAVHLFERDCSLQRRHQKVIEEAPAPGMTEDMRAAMGQAAVRAAEAIGYAGAGTVEFIVDGSDGLRPDGFWFMEMNTRLQVEHPVTEAITGVDLVEWQLRVAAGEAIPAEQQDLSITGHSFEARLYAEDVPAGFLPATGRLDHLAFPPGVRADSGVETGDEISPFYDPMIAKVISHGPTRAIALAQLAQGLADTQVAGSVTNIAFLGALCAHEGFRVGEVDTGLIARDLEALTQDVAPSNEVVAVAAAKAAGLLDGLDAESGFALWGALTQSIALTYRGARMDLRYQVRSEGHLLVMLDAGEVELIRSAGRWLVAGQLAPDVVLTDARVTVFSGQGYEIAVLDPLDVSQDAGQNADIVLAPMPGLVKSIFASPGQTVAKGDRLAILEAMKMEHALLAARDGVIAEVLAIEGDQVEAGVALIQLAQEEAA